MYLRCRSAPHARVFSSHATGQDVDGSGTIDPKEFMNRAAQYQSLSVKISQGHTCRRGSLKSVPVQPGPELRTPAPAPATPEPVTTQHDDGMAGGRESSPELGSSLELRASVEKAQLRDGVASASASAAQSIISSLTEEDKETARHSPFRPRSAPIP